MNDLLPDYYCVPWSMNDVLLYYYSVPWSMNILLLYYYSVPLSMNDFTLIMPERSLHENLYEPSHPLQHVLILCM